MRKRERASVMASRGVSAGESRIGRGGADGLSEMMGRLAVPLGLGMPIFGLVGFGVE